MDTVLQRRSADPISEYCTVKSSEEKGDVFVESITFPFLLDFTAPSPPISPPFHKLPILLPLY